MSREFDFADSSLIETLPVAVYVCDRAGQIIRFNRHAVELWGRTPQDGDRFCGSYRLLNADSTPLAHDACPMEAVLRTGDPVRGAEVIVERPDGSRMTISATIVPITGPGGDVVGAVNAFHDITPQKQAEAELRDFVENATEGLHWVGPDGTILWVNQAELELLGYQRDEYVGRHIADFHVDRATIDDILARLTRGEMLRNYEARMRCKGGSIKYVLINSSVMWRGSEFVHTRCFTRDVTDRRHAEELLRETAKLKDEFVLTVAHELRQPLAPVITAIELLKLPRGAEASVRTLEVLERQVHHLRHLVDDLLDAARIATGKLELRFERLNVCEVVNDVVEGYTSARDGRRWTVEVPDTAMMIDADRHRIEQILVNLLTNAIKFTADGEIGVTVRRRGDQVVISVRDTGRGIPTDRLPYIFDLFVQASNTDGSGGLGIGLAVVRRLVEAHGGQVEARSHGEDHGSEFVVELPSADGP